MKNFIEELEKKAMPCNRIRIAMPSDIRELPKLISLRSVKLEVSALREELKKRSYCSMGHLVSHDCMDDEDCDYVIRVEDIYKLLGEK